MGCVLFVLHISRKAIVQRPLTKEPEENELRGGRDISIGVVF